ncbi:Pre-mRNA-processing factor 39 [Geodia barretti]|nr:Pre-mRNA-processing factor 39 [Geodia barretti]
MGIEVRKPAYVPHGTQPICVRRVRVPSRVSVYDRAVDSCGLDYRSTGIWEAYIGWESGGGRQERVTALYDRLLATPTKDLATHFDNFKKLLETTPTSQMLSEEEYRDMTSQAGDVTQGEAMLDGYVRKVTLEQRTAVFERTMAELEKRKHFELMIKRPYFHVKPLERLQLKNWRDYLDFEISQGDPRRIEFLFERCVVSCALYEDFWSKYCKYAETHIREWASAIYRRACNIHLQQKPNIHVAWAAFEEKNGNVDTAREILTSVDRAVPGQVAVRVRRIGLEIRAGRYSEANALYQETLSSTMALETRNFYAWRYARFTDKLMRDHGKAVSVMTTAVDMDPSNTTLYLQLLDLHTSGPAPPDMPAAEALFAKVASSPHLSEEAKDSFLTRRQQLLEEFGGNFSDLLEVTEMCEKIARKTRKRLASEADGGPAKKTTGDQPQLVTMPTSHPMGMVQPLTPDQQQWAAYQQQWAGYNYAQPQQGQLYQGYYPPYPYSQASATT